MSTQIETDATSLAVPVLAKQRSPAYFAWRRFLANKAAVVGGVVLAIIVLMAILAPLFTKTDPSAQSFLTQSLAFPSAEFWFGVDDL
ncbi:MAG: ABC transporter permease, partial [Alphaproteobacteria bacterium]